MNNLLVTCSFDPRCTAVNFHVDLGCVLRACVSAKAPASAADKAGWVSYQLVPATAGV